MRAGCRMIRAAEESIGWMRRNPPHWLRRLNGLRGATYGYSRQVMPESTNAWQHLDARCLEYWTYKIDRPSRDTAKLAGGPQSAGPKAAAQPPHSAG